MRALALSGGKDSMACLYLMQETLDCAIWVDTGFAHEETKRVIQAAADLIPVHIVLSDRKAQNDREGIPSDVVPIDWTALGQLVTKPKPVTIQSYLGCCFENIMAPLWRGAKALGVTEIVFGQRNADGHRGPARNGEVIDGITRLHPIEDWSDAQVLEYLADKMTVPAHFSLKHSSLDCYDCTAYASDTQDRVEWMRTAHPDLYGAYRHRADALQSALLVAQQAPMERGH